MDVSPKLEELLSALPDADFAARVRMVCQASARTIEQLQELELVQYEEPDVDGSADLSTWEKVAPVIASTLQEVNVLVAQMEASFPPWSGKGDARQVSIDAQVQSATQELKSHVMQFGMRVRDPSVVGDRWALITEIQIYRSRFRDRIGLMVWTIASELDGEVVRSQVEPGYDQALANTLVIRSMTADLRRLMRARIHKVSDAGPLDLLPQSQQMERELNAFGRTAAWRVLRAQDKKGILEFKSKLRQLIASGTPAKLDILSLLEPFVEFVDGFAGISQREILQQHDQEKLANAGLAIERAMSAVSLDDKLSAYQEALGAGEALYGRSPDFDVFLRVLRKGLPPPEQLNDQLEQFVVQIAGMTQY